MADLMPGNIPLSHRLHTTAKEIGARKIPAHITGGGGGGKKRKERDFIATASQSRARKAFASINKCGGYLFYQSTPDEECVHAAVLNSL